MLAFNVGYNLGLPHKVVFSCKFNSDEVMNSTKEWGTKVVEVAEVAGSGGRRR